MKLVQRLTTIAIIGLCTTVSGFGRLALAGHSEESSAERTLLGDPAGLRSDLADRGLTVETELTGDYTMLLAGGRSPRAIADRYLIETDLTLDTRAAFGLPGGTLRVSYAGFHGDNGSRDSGDFQIYSNIDAEPFDALYTLWYRQKLLDDRLTIKVGKTDANDDFAKVDNSSGFVHSSPGFSPTIQGFPSYPNPATSVSVFTHPGAGLYLGAGVYDGATQAGVRTGTRGPSTFYGKPGSLFWIGESGLDYGDRRSGHVGLGVWRHDGEFERFRGGSTGHADGAYLVWDQTLYANNASARKVGLFGQYGRADDTISEVDAHAGAGVEIQALLNDRPDDVTGLMISRVNFTDEPNAGFSKHHETAVEVFHAVQALTWLVMKPDLQYIANPGGHNLDNATVVTLRAQITL